MIHWNWHIQGTGHGGAVVRCEGSILGSMVVFFLVVSLFTQAGPGGFAFTCELTMEPHDGMEVEINYQIGESRFSKDLNVVAYSTSQVREDHIYIFYDHPGVNGSYYTRVAGLYDHMSARFDLYGYEGGVSLIGLEELRSVIQGPNATLIIASQPSNSSSLEQDMQDWVMDGGVVIGIGNKSVPFVKDPTCGETDGCLSIRFDDLSFMNGEGMCSTTWSDAFDLQVIAPTRGMWEQDILEAGGKVVGYTYQRDRDLVSSALFELGSGKLLMMSGDMFLPIITSGEEAYAHDLSRMIVGNVLWMVGDPLIQHVSAGPEAVNGTMMGVLPPSPYVKVVALTTDAFQDIFYGFSFPIDQSSLLVVPTMSQTYGSPLSRAT
jgi:hypothetical protein